MKVCSTENMQIAERELIVSGTPARTLMKLASSGIAESLMQFFPDPGLCVAYVGKGNNGGDALTVLNILKQHGWEIGFRTAYPRNEWSELSVRQLAEKTMASTSEVGKVVTAIQESTTRSVRSVESAVEQIAQAADLAHQSGQALENIVTDADAAADQVSAIAAASEEQSAASEEINQSIEQVNAISGELAQAMGQASQAINDLAAQAQNLSRLIEDMKHA